MRNSFFNLTGNLKEICPYSTDDLVREFNALQYSWSAHFNSKDYSGNWESLALYSVSGRTDDIRALPDGAYQPTELLRETPALQEFLGSLPFVKQSVRLLKLSAHSSILPHRDLGLAYPYGSFRLHIPLITSDEIDFRVGGELIHMAVGECWYCDFDKEHSVVNDTGSDRVHLVIDGLRNDNTDRLFTAAGYDFAADAPLKNKETILATINELSRFGTEAASQLISELKNQLREG